LVGVLGLNSPPPPPSSPPPPPPPPPSVLYSFPDGRETPGTFSVPKDLNLPQHPCENIRPRFLSFSYYDICEKKGSAVD